MTHPELTPGQPSLLTGGELRLPTPPGVLRRFWARHPWWVDSLLAGLYWLPTAAGVVLELFGDGPRSPAAIVWGLAVTTVIAGVILNRRRAPQLGLVVALIGLLLALPAVGPGSDIVPVMIMLYAVAVYRGTRPAWIWLAVAIIVATVSAAVHEGIPDIDWRATAAQNAILILIVTLIGSNIGNRRRYVVALVELAAQLARERDQQAKLAGAMERARIAREMHDIVSHSLSVIVALADGADALAVKDPERSRSAMREVAVTGRGSMTEMRRLLGVLREGAGPGSDGDGRADAPLMPQPGADQLVDLVETFRVAGLPVQLDVTGQIPHDPGVQLTVYRIVQESLTNALRYAVEPHTVTARVLCLPTRIQVAVTDDGRSEAALPRTGTGRGIIGLSERVALYDGELSAGPGPYGGWRVLATLNVEEEPPQ